MSRDNSEDLNRSPLDWPLETGAAADVLEEIARLRTVRRSRRMRFSALALVAAALGVGTWWGSGAMKSPSALTGMPDRRELADGSVVQLKSDAEIAVDYTAAARDITLLRGTAHFKVAKNPTRPFIVQAGGLEVRAVGTQFAVELGQTSIEVRVDEGQVAVEKPGQGPDAVRTYVSAGNRVVVDLPAKSTAGYASAAAGAPSSATGDRSPLRVPRMDLAATPLSEVMPVFNQYSGKRIVLADPALGSVQISGVLRADNVDALLELLESNYHIKAEKRGDLIMLGRTQ